MLPAIFSRKIVGWQVYETESSELANEVMRDIGERENIERNQVVRRFDNGCPMKGAMMQALGVIPSFSRPGRWSGATWNWQLVKTRSCT